MITFPTLYRLLPIAFCLQLSNTTCIKTKNTMVYIDAKMNAAVTYYAEEKRFGRDEDIISQQATQEDATEVPNSNVVVLLGTIED